jgi:hypothetical protein
MSLNFSTALRNARATAIISALDAGATAATIKFYSGTKPAITGAAITTQVLLGTCTLSKPCAIALEGVVTFQPIADDPIADNTGTISWARLLNGDGVFVADMNCGVTGSTAILIFNNLSVQAGGLISITSGSLTEGNL